MKRKKYHTIGTDQKSNRKIVGKGKIHTINTHIHDCTNFSGLEQLSTSIKS